MWKRAWIIGIAVTVGTVVLVAREQHGTREKYEAARQKDCVALSVSPEEKHACDRDAQSRKDYTPWWYVLVSWPEGIGIWAVIATGFLIGWQSNETRAAAIATRDSVKLQEVAYKQWVEIAKWENKTPYTQPTVTELEVTLACFIANGTEYPFTMESFLARRGNDATNLLTKHIVAPDSTYPVDVRLKLTAAELLSYRQAKLVVTIVVDTVISDVLEGRSFDRFVHTVTLGANKWVAHEEGLHQAKYQKPN